MAPHRVVILGLSLITVVVAPASAQTIRGVVVDDLTRGPVPGAVIELYLAPQPDTIRTTTNDQGRFTLSVTDAGTYGLRASHPSYLPSEMDSVTIGTGEDLWVELRLGQTAIPLEPLRVQVSRSSHLAGFDERRRIGLGRYLTRGDIENRKAARISDLLSQTPGVRFQRTRSAGMLLTMRSGGANCLPAIWIDDVEVHQNERSTIDDLLRPGVLEAVEIYSSHGAAPRQYVTGPCGVVLFWTRRSSGGEGNPWQWKRVLAGAGAAIILILLLR